MAAIISYRFACRFGFRTGGLMSVDLRGLSKPLRIVSTAVRCDTTVESHPQSDLIGCALRSESPVVGKSGCRRPLKSLGSVPSLLL